MAEPPTTGSEPLLVFAEVMRRLRAQCPWKQEQTHRSLARYLLEETYETLEVLDASGPDDTDDEHLAEELGDLLLQVFFHAAIAEERGAFTLDDVARSITEKMYRRNPHVFGTDAQRTGVGAPLDAASVDAAWQAIKSQERAAPADPAADPAAGLPAGLPALLLAAKSLERRERAGRPTVPRPDGDLGDRLLALVAEANAAGTDPEQALRDALRRT